MSWTGAACCLRFCSGWTGREGPGAGVPRPFPGSPPEGPQGAGPFRGTLQAANGRGSTSRAGASPRPGQGPPSLGRGRLPSAVRPVLCAAPSRVEPLASRLVLVHRWRVACPLRRLPERDQGQRETLRPAVHSQAERAEGGRATTRRVGGQQVEQAKHGPMPLVEAGPRLARPGEPATAHATGGGMTAARARSEPNSPTRRADLARRAVRCCTSTATSVGHAPGPRPISAPGALPLWPEAYHLRPLEAQ